MDPAINNNICEMVAIIQSLDIARTELETIAASGHTGPTPAFSTVRHGYGVYRFPGVL